MDATWRKRLRAALQARYPWVADTGLGPAAVESGECDRCGCEARLVQTCGPGAEQYLGKCCVLRAGQDAWCAGHAAEAQLLLARIAAFPAEVDTVARLWWVASGEIGFDPSCGPALARLELPAP